MSESPQVNNGGIFYSIGQFWGGLWGGKPPPQEPPQESKPSKKPPTLPDIGKVLQYTGYYAHCLYSLWWHSEKQKEIAKSCKKFSLYVSYTASPSGMRDCKAKKIPEKSEVEQTIQTITHILDCTSVFSGLTANLCWYGTLGLIVIHVLTRFLSILSFISLIGILTLGFLTYNLYKVQNLSLFLRQKLWEIIGNNPESSLSISEEGTRAAMTREKIKEAARALKAFQASTYFLPRIFGISSIIAHLRNMTHDVKSKMYIPKPQYTSLSLSTEES